MWRRRVSRLDSLPLLHHGWETYPRTVSGRLFSTPTRVLLKRLSSESGLDPAYVLSRPLRPPDPREDWKDTTFGSRVRDRSPSKCTHYGGRFGTTVVNFFVRTLCALSGDRPLTFTVMEADGFRRETVHGTLTGPRT